MGVPTSATVAHPESEGYGALLTYGTVKGDDLYLPLLVTPEAPIDRQSAPQSQQLPNLAANPEDFVSTDGEVFSRNSFAGGGGLSFAHRPGATVLDSKRFWSSDKLRVRPSEPGTLERIKLAHTTEAVTGTTSTDTVIVMAREADSKKVYWNEGNTVQFATNLLAATPTITTETPGTASSAPGGAQAVNGLATLGASLYAAVATDGCHQRDGAGTWTEWSQQQVDDVWAVKGHVLGVNGATLYDLLAGTASIAIKTLDDPTDTWLAVIDAGSAILAAATDGQVYAFTVDAGSLVERSSVPMQIGEVCYAMGFTNGLVFLGTGSSNTSSGTTGRLYVAQMVGLTLRNARLVREFEESAADSTPRGFLVTRDGVFFCVTDAAERNVWRYELSTAGLSQELEISDTESLCRGMTMIDGRLILTSDQNGLVRETTSYEASGYVILPAADFFSSAVKSWIGLRLASLTLDTLTAAKITLAYSTDLAALEDPTHASWTEGIALEEGETEVQTAEVILSGVRSRYLLLKITLTPTTDLTGTPEVHSAAARGFFSQDDVVITVPVNISDMVYRPGKIPLHVTGRGVELYAALRGREGRPADMKIVRTGEIVRGRVQSVRQVQLATAKRGSSLTVAMVTVRGQDAS